MKLLINSVSDEEEFFSSIRSKIHINNDKLITNEKGYFEWKIYDWNRINENNIMKSPTFRIGSSEMKTFNKINNKNNVFIDMNEMNDNSLLSNKIILGVYIQTYKKVDENDY
ncbi:hypothetical protein PIROE2DRAFT_15521 [Piromyces sp. E2]|nr:hypothetical protein PIROE2DRAFT_15521 [Piromyces sp. E2]|eukprot:OUM59063.1 hypothetical protein PIROE2DRAFT_15521 [Piromyces sp. E2]